MFVREAMRQWKMDIIGEPGIRIFSWIQKGSLKFGVVGAMARSAKMRRNVCNFMQGINAPEIKILEEANF